jgi:short-subunit dehydrogenase
VAALAGGAAAAVTVAYRVKRAEDLLGHGVTYRDRIKTLSRHRAEYGFGAPKITAVIDVVKLLHRGRRAGCHAHVRAARRLCRGGARGAHGGCVMTAPPEESLSGRVALVTGGTRGIGAAICNDLARRGAAVAAGFSSNRERADAFLRALPRSAGGASVHQGNVGDPEDCARVVSEVIDEHGRLDIPVTNAGVTMDRPVSAMTVDEWHTVLRVNLSGAVYAASKAGLLGLTKTLAREAALAVSKSGKDDRIGLTVNAVTPGLIETDMTLSALKRTARVVLTGG